MRNTGHALCYSVLITALLLAVNCLDSATEACAAEQRLDSLQVGTLTYQNVTVTTKGKDYVFILHSKGMNNVKVSDLSAEAKEQLGYVTPTPKTEQAATWAKQTLARVETAPQVKEIETKLQAQLGLPKTDDPTALFNKLLSPEIIGGVAAGCFLWYFFNSWCCYLIVKKTGAEPGAMVWLPLLKVFPLLRAAGMSGWWVLAGLVPILNLIACILWCLNIAKARGKSALAGILLLLPLVNFFAFLYLAFSKAAGAEEEKKSSSGKIQLASLQPA